MASFQDRTDSQICPVCLEHFKQPRKLPTCEHVFCETCISDTIRKLKTWDDESGSGDENESEFSCPLCRVVNRYPGSTDLLAWIATLEMAEHTEANVENTEVCMPCKKLNKTARAVKYCVDCRESLCAQCFEETQKFNIFQGHIIIEINGDDKDTIVKRNVWVINETLARFLACKHHPDKNVNLVCEIHEELCCQSCVISNHSGCDKVTEIQQHIRWKEDKEENPSKLEQPIEESVNRFIGQCQNVIKDIRDNETENKTAAEKIEQTLRDMRAKANQLFDVLEENITQESKALLKKESLSNDTTVHEIEEMVNKLKLSSSLLENATVKEDRTLKYIVSRRLLDLFCESETKLLETSHNTKMYGFELKPSTILSDFIDVDINETTKLATLKLTNSEFDLRKHTMRSRKFTKIGAYNIHAPTSPGDYHVYSSLMYTPDNKLLVVDSRYGMICLVSDTYTYLTFCNGTTFNTRNSENDSAKKVFSATFLGDDVVAASVPKKKTMFVIKADRTLKFQAEIDTLHSAKAVVALNNGDIAVSWTDPAAFGIVSCKFFHLEEKTYFNNDKSGRVFKSFDYMAVDQKKSHVIQPCEIDKVVFCFDLEGNPIFEYKHIELNQPAGVGIDASGNVYVCDTASACIHIISSNGYPIAVHKEDIPRRPLALAFDKVGTTFAVTQRTCFRDADVEKRKEICVFRLSE